MQIGGSSWLDANDAILNGAGGEVSQFLSDWTGLQHPGTCLGLALDWPRLHFLHCVAIDYVCCGCMQEMNTNYKSNMIK